MEKLHVGVIGAGAISDIYLQNMTGCPWLSVDRIAAGHVERARKKAEVYGAKACTVEELLADPSIDLVVNLTPVGAHEGLIRRALEAGKHVYTEKTLTDDFATGKELFALAKEKGLVLACAPETFMGSAWQTARKAIDEGRIGTVTSFAIACNRDNRILLSAFSFLRDPKAGVVNDYAVYPVTALVSLLGPVKEVASYVRAPYPKHVNILPMSPDFGKEMDTPAESEISVILQMESGVAGTLHINCDSLLQDQAYFTIFGTDGILFLSDANSFGGEIRLLPNSPDPRTPLPAEVLAPVNEYTENSRGIGPMDIACALQEGRKSRVDAQMALHVQDVLTGILVSGSEHRFVSMETSMERPEPFFGFGQA